MTGSGPIDSGDERIAKEPTLMLRPPLQMPGSCEDSTRDLSMASASNESSREAEINSCPCVSRERRSSSNPERSSTFPRRVVGRSAMKQRSRYSTGDVPSCVCFSATVRVHVYSAATKKHVKTVDVATEVLEKLAQERDRRDRQLAAESATAETQAVVAKTAAVAAQEAPEAETAAAPGVMRTMMAYLPSPASSLAAGDGPIVSTMLEDGLSATVERAVTAAFCTVVLCLLACLFFLVHVGITLWNIVSPPGDEEVEDLTPLPLPTGGKEAHSQEGAVPSDECSSGVAGAETDNVF